MQSLLLHMECEGGLVAAAQVFCYLKGILLKGMPDLLLKGILLFKSCAFLSCNLFLWITRR